MKVWAGDTYVRRNMDAVAICMLRRAICMLHDFFVKIDHSTNPFLFRRKLSILHRNIDTARILHVAIYAYCDKKSQHAYCNKKIGNFKSK